MDDQGLGTVDELQQQEVSPVGDAAAAHPAYPPGPGLRLAVQQALELVDKGRQPARGPVVDAGRDVAAIEDRLAVGPALQNPYQAAAGEAVPRIAVAQQA